MTIAGLENAAEAMTKKTGVVYRVKAISGFYHLQHVTPNGTCSVMCAKSKLGLFNAICDYLQGFQAGRTYIPDLI
jgi:hypothetical protein